MENNIKYYKYDNEMEIGYAKVTNKYILHNTVMEGKRYTMVSFDSLDKFNLHGAVEISKQEYESGIKQIIHIDNGINIVYCREGLYNETLKLVEDENNINFLNYVKLDILPNTSSQ